MIVQALATLYHLQKLSNVVGDPEEHAEFRSNIRHFNHHLAESAKYQAVLGLVAANISHIPCTEVRKPYAGLPKPVPVLLTKNLNTIKVKIFFLGAGKNNMF